MSITTAQITWRFHQIYSEDIFTFYIAHFIQKQRVKLNDKG